MNKSIAVNTIFNVSYKVLNMLFPLVTSVYLARVLGPTYIGKVSYAQSILSYFIVIASLGIPTYGMREISKQRNDINSRNKVFSELFMLNMMSTVVCSLMYTILIFCVGSFRCDLKLFLSVGLSLYLNVFNIDWFYSGQEEYIYITLRSLVIKLISLVAILVAVNNQDDYILYALITSIATTGNYIWNVVYAKKKINFQIKNLELKKHLKPVSILLMTMLATDLYNQLDITMLGVLRTDAEVGYYSNGIRIIRMINSVTTAVGATILPRMCLYHKEQRINQYKHLFWQTMDIVILLASPCVVGICLVARQMVVVLFGQQFLPTAQIVTYLSPVIFIISVSYLFGSIVLTSTNNERYLLRATIGGSIVNIVLNALLISLLGTIGAAIASVVGEMIVCVIHFRYGKEYVKRSVSIRYIVSIICSLIVMGSFVVIIQRIIAKPIISLITSIAGGAILYFVMLAILRNPVIKLLTDGKKYKLRRK